MSSARSADARDDPQNPRGQLDGAVAVVTGASRGAGRAIAEVLGEHGATVYVTGRSTRSAAADAGRGSVEDTAEAVTRRGGVGIAVRCDHTVASEVELLFERVRSEQGHLDLLVNNAWGGYEQRGQSTASFFGAPFWEQPLWRWEAMFVAGVRAHYLAARVAMPLLLERPTRTPRLIVSTIAWAYGAYLGNLLYDTAKAATARMAFGMAEELRSHNIASLASDPDVMTKSGLTLAVGDLAREYGFTDIDGTQPEPFALPERDRKQGVG